METGLTAAMCSGLYVEFVDAEACCVGQAVFTDWKGRAVPLVGDTIACPSQAQRTGSRKLVGKVRVRQFEVQTTAQGKTEVWVRLVADLIETPVAATRRARCHERWGDFSTN